MTVMADDPKVLDSPDRIAEEGQRLYEERHKANLEQNRRGEYVAIDVLTGNAYIAKFPELAIEEARKQAPNGVFHLIRIGAPGAFKVSFGSRHGFWGRSLRQPR
ncbi:MAG: hypothetical protein HYY76_07075 [Acidobacteria bacterium]|nr:hypothetical protein [Acidobacteriota bacterium]